jgi:short-subunit dehydrogenase involved in D-alanine esterification of teichoic acids
MFEKGLLAGKRILITGGGSGLGAAMGRRFAELGAELIICGRRLEALEATAAAIQTGPRAIRSVVPVSIASWPILQAS